MRLACSPMFSATGRIASLTQVVLRLGFSAIKQLALVVASRSRVFQVAGFTDVVRETFRHSLLCALFAQEIARVRRANVEEAFTAGLLHDIGRPLLLQVLVDLHRGHALAPEPQEVLAAAQAEHARAGAALVESWLLPARVAEAVRSHHAPAGELSHEVALADALAHGGPSPQADLAAAALNLYPEDVDALARRGDDLARMMEQLA
jgi:putative nucleotidyltransferase with HDIG domain